MTGGYDSDQRESRTSMGQAAAIAAAVAESLNRPSRATLPKSKR